MSRVYLLTQRVRQEKEWNGEPQESLEKEVPGKERKQPASEGKTLRYRPCSGFQRPQSHAEPVAKPSDETEIHHPSPSTHFTPRSNQSARNERVNQHREKLGATIARGAPDCPGDREQGGGGGGDTREKRRTMKRGKIFQGRM